MNTLYYPDNFPKEKEEILVLLFKYLLKEKPNSDIKIRKKIQFFLKDKKIDGFFPAFWMLNFVYWRHFSAKTKFPDFMNFLIKNKVRSQSGIVPLSLFTKPQDSCPFKCIYCTTQQGAPKSYFKDEAAVRRAIRSKFDPYKQTLGRLIQFFLSGHPISKVDVIIQGGTFSFYEKKYREDFVNNIFAALNIDVKKMIITGEIPSSTSFSLLENQKNNEEATSRCVGLTIETRPDFICDDEILFLRKLGVTRVEIGVQSVNDDILKKINRGHTTLEVIKASKMLKESGLKITYHLMPGLPGCNYKTDLENLKEVFTNTNYLPDAIKLYPTQLVKDSALNELYKNGSFKIMSEKDLLNLTLEFKRDIVPKWVRIQRNVRDLTNNDQEIISFPSNFRQNLFKFLKKNKVECRCIRCREIKNNKIIGKDNIKIFKYDSSDGIEYFIESCDEKEQLLGFVRLRIPEHYLKNQDFFIKEIEKGALIRELHVYGKQIEIGGLGKVQHLGLGKKLIVEAEKIAKESGVTKIAIISGVGVRKYYENLGYKLVGNYMVKILI